MRPVGLPIGFAAKCVDLHRRKPTSQRRKRASRRRQRASRRRKRASQRRNSTPSIANAFLMKFFKQSSLRSDPDVTNRPKPPCKGAKVERFMLLPSETALRRGPELICISQGPTAFLANCRRFLHSTAFLWLWRQKFPSKITTAFI